MKYWHFTVDNYSAVDFRAVVAALIKGQVAILPTDTIYGFSCVFDNEAAIKKIYRLKRRSAHKPMIILVSSLSMAKKFVKVSDHHSKLLSKFWSPLAPPSTLILPGRPVLPALLRTKNSTLAVRLPKNPFLIKIIKAVGRPLVSTSLNASGDQPVTDLSALPPYWAKGLLKPDFVVDTGPSLTSRPSRLIDLCSGPRPIFLRK